MPGACDLDQAALERYLDEELGGSEQRRTTRHIEACPACQSRLEGLRLGADLLRSHLDEIAEQADFAGFEQRVLAALEAQRPPALGERLWLWLRESLVHHRAAWVASAATAAALMLLVGLLAPTGPGPRIALPDPVGPAGDQTASVDNEVIIDSLEYTGNRSMIFTVSKNNTTVIWMYDFDRPGAKSSQGDDI